MQKNSPKLAVRPPKVPPHSSQSMEKLLEQLELVQRFAQEGFWLTTEELATLLQIDSSFLGGRDPFPWRNFLCSQVEIQGNQQLWQISAKGMPKILSMAPIPTPFPASPVIVTPITPTSEVIPSVFAQIENFLTPAQHEELLQFCFAEKDKFVSTTNSAGDTEYRKSMVLYNFPRFSDLILDRIQKIVPFVLTYLQCPTFTIADIECQLTQHNDGNYYRVHNDNGSPDCANRLLTYVYYFYREPKGFSGGELRIYDMHTRDGYMVAADSFRDVQPLNNSVVFFFSQVMHEVLPVSCPSKDFADSRFTINGWVRKA